MKRILKILGNLVTWPFLILMCFALAMTWVLLRGWRLDDPGRSVEADRRGVRPEDLVLRHGEWEMKRGRSGADLGSMDVL